MMTIATMHRKARKTNGFGKGLFRKKAFFDPKK
jgi:hypothetical protein